MEHGKQTDKSLDFPGTTTSSRVRMKNNGYGTIFCHVLGHNTMRQFLFEQQICNVSKFVTYSSLKRKSNKFIPRICRNNCQPIFVGNYEICLAQLVANWFFFEE